jgi:hypothetical protein
MYVEDYNTLNISGDTPNSTPDRLLREDVNAIYQGYNAPDMSSDNGIWYPNAMYNDGIFFASSGMILAIDQASIHLVNLSMVTNTCV